MRQDILVGVERRRRWSLEEKRRIVAAADEDGVSLSDVARRFAITRQHIYQWRHELRRRDEASGEPASFVAVEMVEGGAAPRSSALVEIGLRNGRSLRIGVDAPDAVLRRLMRIVEGP